EDPPVAIELRHVRLVSPADEEVVVGKALRVALVDGEQRRVVDEAADEQRAPTPQVQSKDDGARLATDLWGRFVVEQRARPVGKAPRVVLPGEACAGAEPEVALRAAQPPDDRSGAAIQLV